MLISICIMVGKSVFIPHYSMWRFLLASFFETLQVRLASAITFYFTKLTSTVFLLLPFFFSSSFTFTFSLFNNLK